MGPLIVVLQYRIEWFKELIGKYDVENSGLCVENLIHG